MRPVGATPTPSPVGERIIAAIKERRRLSFSYHGQRRFVEPQCLGFTAKNLESLRGYLPHGGEVSERLFTIAEMSDLIVLDEHFSKPGPHYTKGDSAMKVILAEL